MDKDTNKADGIPVKKIYRNGKEWVDARSLHHDLKIKNRFRVWIIAHLKRYDFTCGVDYELFLLPRRGNNRKEYYLSPEMVEKILIHERKGQLYTFDTFFINERQFRVTILDGKAWFVKRDIFHILNLSQNSTSRVYKIDVDDRKTILLPNDQSPVKVLPCVLISEYGLLYVAFRSNAPNAIEIRKWLIYEALPHIRKAFVTAETFPTAEPSLSLFQKFFQFFKSFTGGVK